MKKTMIGLSGVSVELILQLRANVTAIMNVIHETFVGIKQLLTKQLESNDVLACIARVQELNLDMEIYQQTHDLSSPKITMGNIVCLELLLSPVQILHNVWTRQISSLMVILLVIHIVVMRLILLCNASCFMIRLTSFHENADAVLTAIQHIAAALSALVSTKKQSQHY